MNIQDKLYGFSCISCGNLKGLFAISTFCGGVIQIKDIVSGLLNIM